MRDGVGRARCARGGAGGEQERGGARGTDATTMVARDRPREGGGTRRATEHLVELWTALATDFCCWRELVLLFPGLASAVARPNLSLLQVGMHSPPS